MTGLFACKKDEPNMDPPITNPPDMLTGDTAILVGTWDWQQNENGSWSYINSIRQFMEGIPLDEENWIPGVPIVQTDKSIETYYLRSQMINDNRKLVGIVGNRTFNYFTQTELLMDTCFAIEPTTTIYQTPQDFNYFDLLEPILIPNVTNSVSAAYQINWYNAQTGSLIDTFLTITNSSGQLELVYPGTLTGDQVRPMLFFEAFVIGSSIKASNNLHQNKFLSKRKNDTILSKDQTSVELNPQSKLGQPHIYVVPNPTNNDINITINSPETFQYKYELFDQNGHLILEGFSDNPNFSLDLNVFSRGFYILRVSSRFNTFTEKIVKI